jgi:hypothetical protein
MVDMVEIGFGFDKALEIFGLDKLTFNQMKKSDLIVFIQSATKQESNLKCKYGKLLLDSKTKAKKVTINVPENQQTHPSSISFNYYAPTSASIDILFSSLISFDSSSTFI